MSGKHASNLFVAALTISLSLPVASQPGFTVQKAQQPVAFEQALGWLPADTETIVVANGPFAIPSPTKDELGDDESKSLSAGEVQSLFQSFAMPLTGTKDGLLGKYLEGRTAVLAVEGSRHFRAPKDLGEMLYEGCDIIVLASDEPGLGDSFLNANKSLTKLVEVIGKHRVAVFEEQMERDLWTTYVVFPRPNVVLIATSREYLKTVLERMDGAGGARALPDALPEWHFIQRDAPAWGLRHFDRSQANLDPTSPFGVEKSANSPDDKAIGVSFEYQGGNPQSATITYFSSASDPLSSVKQTFFNPNYEKKSVEDLQVRYQTISPGVVHISCKLAHSGGTFYFFFVLSALIGHAVYV